mmetsp:Transcript_11152/g.21930  ORF Transcript_11152/g.21930 Transcript_11152/m.21930 type:complete len:98 (+) Transcript_11152:1297-1590(+)
MSYNYPRNLVPQVPRKRARSPDFKNCEDILSRHIKPDSYKPKLPTTARKRPEQIAEERSLDLASFMKDIKTNDSKTMLGKVLNPRNKRPPPQKKADK